MARLLKDLRVLFVDQSAQLGGAELSLFDVVSRRAGRHDVLLFEEGPLAEMLRACTVDVAVLPLAPELAAVRKGGGLFGQLTAMGSAAGMIRKLRRVMGAYDVVYANTPKAMVLSAVAISGSRRPLIYHLRDVLSADHFSDGNRRLLVHLANRAAWRVVANSQATAEAFTSAGGDRSRVVVIPNGFDTAPYARAAENREVARRRLRQELRLDPGARLLAHVGRLAEWKGQHVAIEAMQRLPEGHLLLVGEALFGEEAYAQRLRRQAATMGGAGRVHFMGFRSDVPEILQAADAILHTSIAPEPFGRVLVEGMLSRCPVIATRGGGTNEILDHGETGLLVEPGSAKALASAVGYLFGDSLRASRLVEKAYQQAADRYRIEPVVAQIDAVIAEAGGVTGLACRASGDGARGGQGHLGLSRGC